MRHLILTCFLFCGFVNSTEIDSFTNRDPTLRDGLLEMNAIMQEHFKKAIAKANKAQSCEAQVFENALHKLTGGLFWSELEYQIEKLKTLDKRTVSRENSIYQDTCFEDGCALYMAKLGFIIRIGDLYIGSDKFGHFIDQGYDYSKEESLDAAMSFGEMTERTYYGLLTTAVYSYGDLSANLEGYRFWSHVAQGDNAYVTCENNVWSQKKAFDWMDYLNAAWDEGINCSAYKNNRVTEAVYQRITNLGFTCPVDKSYCPGMLKRYGYLAPRVITQACFY